MMKAMEKILIYAAGGLLALFLAVGIHQRLGARDRATTQNPNNMKTIHLTKKDFLEKVVNYEKEPGTWRYLGDKPAIIDFYADWCGPCKRLAPELEALAEEYGDRIYIYKINTEQEQELAGVFGIRSIPTLIFVPMEGEPRIAQGALPRPQLKQLIDEVLLPDNK